MSYGLIGYPLGHSLSPFIHKELFRLAGLDEESEDYKYELYEIPPETLTQKFELLKSFDGINITIPLKTQIIPFCSSLDESACVCGAVNCIYSGIGYNTDVYGFLKSVEILGANLKSRVCVIGMGGAGRMFVSEALRQGADLTVAVRRESNFKNYNLKIKTVFSEELSGEFDFIINASPVGMFPKINISPISFENVSAECVFDAVYNPVKTKFLSDAEKTGANVLGGTAMLVWQAVKSHEIWNGSVYKDSDIADLIKKTIEKINKFN